MSMIIIAFKGAPQVSEEEQRREEELNRRIEGKVTGNIDLRVLLQIAS